MRISARTVQYALLGVIATTLTACGSSGSGSLPAAGQPFPTTGTFANLAVDYYPCCGNLTGQFQIQSAVDQYLRQDGWQDVEFEQDGTVSGNSIASAAQNADALFFAGHGGVGDLAFSGYNTGASTNDQYWGVGSADGSMPANTFGTPLAGRLKWMFLSSSDTVAPEQEMDWTDSASWVAPNYAWKQVFMGGGETLRGIYGYWQGPNGNCGGRVCDVVTGPDLTAMQNLLEHIWPAGAGQSATQINDAWQSANEIAGMSDRWSIMQDCGATNDTFSGQTSAVGDSSLFGYLCFTAPNLGTNIPQPHVAVQAQSFTLEPYTLAPRSVDVASLVQKAQTNLPVGTVQTFDNGSIRRYVSQSGLVVSYYYGLSGAVEYVGHSAGNPVAFTEADAQNAAQEFIQQSYGMPSDAQLTDVLPVYRWDTAAGSRTLVQYEFVWRHTGNVFGGDAIRVNVFDLHKVWMTCSQWGYVEVWDPIIHDFIDRRECVSWTRNISDTPDISFSYYLWREPTSTRHILLAGRSTGGSSIDAYTASLSLPNPQGVTAYTSGYWTGGPYDSDTTEHPAWLFTTSNGSIMAVDAFTGALLGPGE